MVFSAFYSSSPGSFPMEMQALSSYIWLRQSLLRLIDLYAVDYDIFSLIESGDIAYELCRPLDLYGQWFAKSSARRIAEAALRCLPVLLLASLLPAPYGMSLPASPQAMALFLLSGILALLLTLAWGMLQYAISILTLAPRGVQRFFSAIADFFAGGVIPLPFFPKTLRAVAELLPFASTQDIPFRIYGGNIAGPDALRALLVQIIWIAVCLAAGKLLMAHAIRRAVVQGG